MKNKRLRQFISLLSLKKLSGKLVFFTCIAGLVVVGYGLFIVYKSARLKEEIIRMEVVYEPLEESLTSIHHLLSELVASLKNSQFERDTVGKSERIQYFDQIFGHIAFIENHDHVFSYDLQTSVDSMILIFNRLKKDEHFFNQWIYSNYLSDDRDSAFIAEIPEREATQLLPFVHQIDSRFFLAKSYIDNLLMDNEAHMNNSIGLMKDNVSSTTKVGFWGFVLVIVVLFGGVSLLLVYFNKSVKGPIRILHKLVQGELPEPYRVTGDELGPIIDASNKLSSNLNYASAFARSIGDGKVEVSFTPVSEKDMLGNSLLQMREKLKAINIEDKRRTWLSGGLAKFADLVRRQEDQKGSSRSFINELVKYTGASVGGLFIYDDNSNDLELSACYAYEREKYLTRRVELGMGLVGQCFLEKRVIYIKDVPENYLEITSGLGGSSPNALLVVPLIVNDEVQGVVELASLKDFEEHVREFVSKVGEIMASTIVSVRINTRTKKLLADSQQRSEEMRAQEEEMRQNMEEMQATQEQLQRQTDEMKKVAVELEMEKTMFHVLLDFIPDYITYKDLNGITIRVNKAKAMRFNRTELEMVGTTDFDFYNREHAEKAAQEESEIISSGKPKINAEEKVIIKETGEIAYASTSRVPLLNDKGVIIGLFVIGKDTTKLKIAESSLQMREHIIEQLLRNLQVFRYSIGRDGVINHLWQSPEFIDFQVDSFEGKHISECFPYVHDMIGQADEDDMDLICKEVMEIEDGEREIFKHHLFRDSAIEGVFVGFAIRQ